MCGSCCWPSYPLGTGGSAVDAAVVFIGLLDVQKLTPGLRIDLPHLAHRDSVVLLVPGERERRDNKGPGSLLCSEGTASPRCHSAICEEDEGKGNGSKIEDYVLQWIEEVCSGYM